MEGTTQDTEQMASTKPEEYSDVNRREAYVKELLTENPDLTNADLLTALRKQFGTGMLCQRLAKVRRSLGINRRGRIRGVSPKRRTPRAAKTAPKPQVVRESPMQLAAFALFAAMRTENIARVVIDEDGSMTLTPKEHQVRLK